MLKNLFICLVVMVILSSAIADEEDKKETIPMPEGFEGISIGISLPDFLKIRPQVRPGGLGPTHETEVDVTKPNQSISEGIENDPLFGLGMLGMYTFRDGKMKHVILIWTGNIDHIRKHRQNFVHSCIERWGNEYQKRIFKTDSGTKYEQLVPLLLWQKGNTIIAAGCTSEYEDKVLKEGVFMIDLFSKDDKETMAIFSGEKVDEELRKKIFRAIGINDDDNKQDND